MFARPRARVSPRAFRFARIALLWLALAMALAQLVAVRHVYSHVPGEAGTQTGSKHSGGVAQCDACIAAVALGAGGPPAAALVIAAIRNPSPPPITAVVASIAPQQRPYAIRAPPISAS